MATETTTHENKPLCQLLEELTDAKLERREGDIARLQEEIGKHQARGETAPWPRPDDTGPKAL